MNKDELAGEITAAFYASEGLVEHVQNYLLKHEVSPMTIVFAGCIVNKMMRQQVEGWDECAAWSIGAFEKLEKDGILGDIPLKKDT